MQNLESLINEVDSQVFKPELHTSLHRPDTKLLVEAYAIEMLKNRIVVNYIVSVMIQGKLSSGEAQALMELASTPEGLTDVYANLSEKISNIILKASECRRFTYTEIKKH